MDTASRGISVDGGVCRRVQADGGGDEQIIDMPATATTGGGIMSCVDKIQNEVIDAAKMESEWRKAHSIYRVPACIKGLNPEAYAPQVVSLGPYHHGEEPLVPTEEHKRRAFVHFLERSGKPLYSFVRVMKEVEKQLMEAYDRLNDGWRCYPERFLQLMIVDGAFMLEIIRYTNDATAAAAAPTNIAPTVEYSKYMDYDSKDPLFSWHGVLNSVPYIKRDMLMIENQVPLLVLYKLATVESDKPMTEDGINRLVLKFLAPNQPHVSIPLGLHPLDVYRKSMLQGPMPKSVHKKKKKKNKPSMEESDIVRSAMEPNEAGIRFKPSKSNSLRDIRFKRGVLSLPVLVVDDLTEYMLLNLMALERLHVGAGNEVSSYVFFMDNIIDSAMDVSLLNSKGIIHNAVGSDKAVAKLFNTLG